MLTPNWRKPVPFQPPSELSYTCRLLDLPGGRQLAVTINGLDERWGVRHQILLQKDTAVPGELPAKGWGLSNTCVVRVPEKVRERADLKGHYLLLFLATRAEGRYVELLQSPMLLSFE